MALYRNVAPRSLPSLPSWFPFRSLSLFWHVLFLFLITVLVAVTTMGISMNWLIAHELENYRDHNALQTENARDLASMLYHALLQNQTRQQIQVLVEQVAQRSDTHVLLIDAHQRISADSSRSFLDYTLSPEQDQGKQSSGAQPVLSCSVFMGRPGAPTLLAYRGRTPPCPAPFSILSLTGDAWSFPLGVAGYVPVTVNRVIIASASDILLFSMLVGGMTAFLLAIVFAWTLLAPLKTLTKAIRGMEQGNLDQPMRIRAHGELKHLANAFERMAMSLREAEHLRRSLLNDIAHELRTPLATIQAYVDALADSILQPTAGVITSLQEEALLLGRLVNDLQELSLAEAGRLSLKKELLDFQSCLQQVLQSMQLRLIQKQVTLQLDIASPLPLIEADKTRIQQILYNLLHNAIRHTPVSGYICVSVKGVQHRIQVDIQDSGEGIASAHLPYVFERFYRVDASRSRQTGGTGLGLAIVKQLVQAHGGKVTVESAPGYGACFCFTLPTTSAHTPPT